MNIYTTRTARPALPRKESSMNAASREALATMTPEELAQRAREAGFGVSKAPAAPVRKKQDPEWLKVKPKLEKKMVVGKTYIAGDLAKEIKTSSKRVGAALRFMREEGTVISYMSGKYSNNCTAWVRIK